MRDNREKSRRFRELHPDYQREYRAAHREQFKIYDAKWAATHPDKVKAKNARQHRRRVASGYITKWIAANQDKIAEYRNRAKERQHVYSARYHNTEKGRRTIHRFTSKRRGIEKITRYLNEPFPGSVLHHAGNGLGIYVPVPLHRSVKHNLKSGEGMVKMNEKVAEWLRLEQ